MEYVNWFAKDNTIKVCDHSLAGMAMHPHAHVLLFAIILLYCVPNKAINAHLAFIGLNLLAKSTIFKMFMTAYHSSFTVCHIKELIWQLTPG